MNPGSPNGIALLDKPGGITSHDAVARARRALGTRRVGHAGTLDPMATGLLLLGAGPSTRLLTHLLGLGKEYLATIRLGISTSTDDAEGVVVATTSAAEVHDAAIQAEIGALSGEILQRPSAVSAIKVDGVRAYERVRSGEAVELAARAVTVSEFAVLARRDVPAAADTPALVDLDVRVRCSSGTYIRALARDLGAALGLGGHLTALRRTAVGPFRVEEAVPVPERGDSVPLTLLDPAAVAARLFPVLRLGEAAAVDLGHGKRIVVAAPDADVVAAIAPDGRLVGLVEVARGQARVLTNFPREP